MLSSFLKYFSALEKKTANVKEYQKAMQKMFIQGDKTDVSNFVT